MKDFDRRQCEIIIKKINAYKLGHIYLADLISDLEGLISILEDGDWKAAFISHWGKLEIVYALALHNEKKQFDNKDQKNIDNSIEILIKMTTTALKDYLLVPDASVVKSATTLDDKWVMCPDCSEAWKLASKTAMVICPKCDTFLHNPHYISASGDSNQDFTHETRI